MSDDRVTRWLAELEARHRGGLSPSEIARALRALSSCYVERRSKLASGGALDGAGKRAAFALFYGPVHLVATRQIVRALPGSTSRVRTILDVGCGTGVAGAAWALEAGVDRVSGFDRHPWAVAEANWTYRRLGLRGRAIHADARRARISLEPGVGIVLAYTVNEWPADVRGRILTRLMSARTGRTSVLVIEPIARRGGIGWWDDWRDGFLDAGGRADEWRFPLQLPQQQADLARAAGLDPRELTARTLFLP